MVIYEDITGSEVISLHSNDMNFIKEQQKFLRKSKTIGIPTHYDKNIGVF